MATMSSAAVLTIVLSFLLRVSSTSADALTTYIVHMDKTEMPETFGGDHAAWYATTAVTAGVQNDGIVYVYDNALHGFSARLSGAQLKALRRAPGFLGCYEDRPVRRHTTHTPAFLGLNRYTGIWPASGFGDDIIIGVVDSGVTPESGSYRDDGLSAVPQRWKGFCESGVQFDAAKACNRKLIGARKFIKGLLAANPNLTIAVESPRDTDGHGTHTSSTAAGSPVPGASFFGYAPGTAQGVAPQAKVAMYKALWEDGATSSDVVAAVDAALLDGVDVLSLSLGLDGVPLYEDPIAIAAFAAAAKGVVVSASSGNEGPILGSLHNGAPWLITVGATTIDREYAATLRLGDGTSIIADTLYPGDDGRGHAVITNRPIVNMGQCGNLSSLQAVGQKIVVCTSKNFVADTTFTLQIAKVDAAIIISDDPAAELFWNFVYPAAMVSTSRGAAILRYISTASNPTASITFGVTVLGTKPAPVVTEYTSRGPSSACPTVLKPDVAAPGSLILASWSRNSPATTVDYGDRALYYPFNVISGTSMACPHVAGVAALIRRVHPGWSPAAVRSAIVTTANPLDSDLAPIKDLGTIHRAATPLAMGSGFVDPNKAVDPGLVYDVSTSDYIKLMCAMNYTMKQIQAVTRFPASAIDCTGATLDINYPSFIALFSVKTDGSTRTDSRTVTFTRTVTNVADGPSAYTATVKAMRGFKVSVAPKTLEFERRGETRSFTVTAVGSMANENGAVVGGSLTWVDGVGRRNVRSPIVATTAMGPTTP